MNDNADKPTCCQDVNNRTEPEMLSDDLVVQYCKVCGRRHLELSVEAGKVGITAAG